MSTIIVQDSILSQKADAVVVSLEMTMRPAEGPENEALAEAGGSELTTSIRALRFLSVGKAAGIVCSPLPFSHVIVTAVPRWITGKANELVALRHCYRSVFTLAAEIGCSRIVSPFLSAAYYRFPSEEAVRIALEEAGKQSFDVVFVAEDKALYETALSPYRKPVITDYIGYYRDHAIFALDNGLYARVDLREEIIDVSVIPYFEACFRTGTDPLQPPLPPDEIELLKTIYEDYY